MLLRRGLGRVSVAEALDFDPKRRPYFRIRQQTKALAQILWEAHQLGGDKNTTNIENVIIRSRHKNIALRIFDLSADLTKIGSEGEN